MFGDLVSGVSELNLVKASCLAGDFFHSYINLVKGSVWRFS